MILIFVLASISMFVNGQKVSCYQKFVGDPTRPEDFTVPPTRIRPSFPFAPPLQNAPTNLHLHASLCIFMHLGASSCILMHPESLRTS